MNTKNDYLKKPNLMRVAAELATYRDPYKVADSMLSIIKSGMKNSTYSQDDFGLLICDVINCTDKSH